MASPVIGHPGPLGQVISKACVVGGVDTDEPHVLAQFLADGLEVRHLRRARGHQEAQKFTTIGVPTRSRRSVVAPSNVVSATHPDACIVGHVYVPSSGVSRSWFPRR